MKTTKTTSLLFLVISIFTIALSSCGGEEKKSTLAERRAAKKLNPYPMQFARDFTVPCKQEYPTEFCDCVSDYIKAKYTYQEFMLISDANGKEFEALMLDARDECE